MATHYADKELQKAGFDISTLTNEQKDLIVEPSYAPENFMQDGEISVADAKSLWKQRLIRSGLDRSVREKAGFFNNMIVAMGGGGKVQSDKDIAEQMYAKLTAADSSYTPISHNPYHISSIALARMEKDGLLERDNEVVGEDDGVTLTKDYFWLNDKGLEEIKSAQDILDNYMYESGSDEDTKKEQAYFRGSEGASQEFGRGGRVKKIYAILYAPIGIVDDLEVDSEDKDAAMKLFKEREEKGFIRIPAGSNVRFSNQPPYYAEDGGVLKNEKIVKVGQVWHTKMSNGSGRNFVVTKDGGSGYFEIHTADEEPTLENYDLYHESTFESQIKKGNFTLVSDSKDEANFKSGGNISKKSFDDYYAQNGAFGMSYFKEEAPKMEDGGLVSLWKIDKGQAIKLKTGTPRAIKTYITVNKLHNRPTNETWALQEWESDVTEQEILRYDKNHSGNATSQEYAKGGVIKFISDDDVENTRHYSYLNKYREENNEEICIGEFATKEAKGRGDFRLYTLNSFDENYYKHIYLKQGERLYRYETYTTSISGMRPIIKVNIEKGLVYYLQDMDADDDKNIIFETKGIKPKWMVISEKEKNRDTTSVKSNFSNNAGNPNWESSLNEYLEKHDKKNEKKEKFESGGKLSSSELDNILLKEAKKDIKLLEREGEMAMANTKLGLLHASFDGNTYIIRNNTYLPEIKNYDIELKTQDRKEAIEFIKSSYDVEQKANGGTVSGAITDLNGKALNIGDKVRWNGAIYQIMFESGGTPFITPYPLKYPLVSTYFKDHPELASQLYFIGSFSISDIPFENGGKVNSELNSEEIGNPNWEESLNNFLKEHEANNN